MAKLGPGFVMRMLALNLVAMNPTRIFYFGHPVLSIGLLFFISLITGPPILKFPILEEKIKLELVWVFWGFFLRQSCA
jgi:hypothetical protein